MKRSSGRRPASVVSLAVVGLACIGGATGPDLDPGPDFGTADVNVLFVGNSLTYTHDVPGLVRALAGRRGPSVSTLTVASPNFSLEDHWNDGLADRIRSLAPDVVVLQQGPSSLSASRDHLVHWSRLIAEVVHEVGGETALYMVWPDAGRRAAFADVEASYAAAADTVGGTLLPAGTTWLRAWDADATLPLYGGDGFHPSYLGALAAAQTIYARLLDVDAADIPSLDDDVPAAQVDLLRSAVGASLGAWTR